MSGTIDIAGLIRRGDRLAWPGGSTEPAVLLAILEDQLDRVPADVSTFLNFSVIEAIDPARLAEAMRIRALGGAVTNRRFQAAGSLEIVPANYSALPDLVASGRLEFDIVLTQLARDGAGLNRSAMVEYLREALPLARTVIAEVNDQAPVTYGDTEVDPADIDHVLETSHPLAQLASRPAGDLERTIAGHVARLIGDGDTLEVGLGALPDAVLEGLRDKRDLGIHSGTIGDRVMELAEAGVITNRRKPIDTGKTVTATLLGTDRLYAWAHRNRAVELRSPAYTHDNAVHAQIPRFIAINSALQVDLTGQINAETLGPRHVGIIGGQNDFVHGALRSPGGRSVIVLGATARKGTVSRIVPALADGVVTTARSDADVVVTEFGLAELRGRTVAERARALIEIAHPDFRAELFAAADRGLI